MPHTQSSVAGSDDKTREESEADSATESSNRERDEARAKARNLLCTTILAHFSSGTCRCWLHATHREKNMTAGQCEGSAVAHARALEAAAGGREAGASTRMQAAAAHVAGLRGSSERQKAAKRRVGAQQAEQAEQANQSRRAARHLQRSATTGRNSSLSAESAPAHTQTSQQPAAVKVAADQHEQTAARRQ